MHMKQDCHEAALAFLWVTRLSGLWQLSAQKYICLCKRSIKMESRHVDSASISSFDLSGKLDKADDEITVTSHD